MEGAGSIRASGPALPPRPQDRESWRAMPGLFPRFCAGPPAKERIKQNQGYVVAVFFIDEFMEAICRGAPPEIEPGCHDARCYTAQRKAPPSAPPGTASLLAPNHPRADVASFPWRESFHQTNQHWRAKTHVRNSCEGNKWDTAIGRWASYQRAVFWPATDWVRGPGGAFLRRKGQPGRSPWCT